MRLGARWQAGSAPHAGVPDALHAAISEQEAAHPEAVAWTLTWLEGRPRCELDGGPQHGGALVTMSASGEVEVWPRPRDATATGHTATDDEDADDDDWLV